MERNREVVYTYNFIRQFLSLSDRLKLWIRGYVYICHAKLEGFKAYLPFYLVKCCKHGYYFDYPHSYDNYFSCPKCFAELLLPLKRCSIMAVSEEDIKEEERIQGGGKI